MSMMGDSTPFAPYELRAPLGRGGMGQVYRAWDPRLQREVALKVLHAHRGSDAQHVRRFVAEARAASALNHPNILAVFDADVDGPTPYIVSELIEGESLRDELRRGPIPLKRLLDLAVQIADGLAEAHAAGIVHRDLKPDNVMVTRAGRVKILDFGLALGTGFRPSDALPPALDSHTLTEPGLIAGTVPYMSPEQARGLPTDFRTDQFSFGLVLYEMAGGQAPFTRDTPARTLDAIVNDDPVPLPTRQPQIPVLLWWIIERCLSKAPDERYASTADLHRDLRLLRERLPDTIKAASVPARRRGPLRLLARAIAAVGALACVTAGVLAWRVSEDVPPVDLDRLTFKALATDAAYEGLAAVSPDGQTVAYAAEVDGVLQIFTRRVSAATGAPVTRSVHDCIHPFWSPEGQRIYYVSLARHRQGIWSIGAAGGTPQLVLENATRAALSHDGRTLAFLRDEERAEVVGTASLWIATPDGIPPWTPEAVQRAARRHDALGARRFIEGALAFSPDGARLALAVVPEPQEAGMWQFWVVPLPQGQPYRRLQWWTDAGPRISSVAWLPDSRHVILGIASLSPRGSHLWLADLQRDRAWQLTRGTGSELYPSVSLDGTRLVFTVGEPDYDVVEIPLEAGAARPVIATQHSESDPALSPDGQQLAYVTDRNGEDEIWRRRVGAGRTDEPLITQSDFGEDRTIMLSSPVFSPGGDLIAYQRSGFRPRSPLRIWISSVAGGVSTPLLPARAGAFQSAPTWSPDGEWIAFAQWMHGRWQLAKFRFGSGESPLVLRDDGVSNASPRWSPRGDWITWETEKMFMLVSADGKTQRALTDDQWLAHAWSPEGTQIFAVRETDSLRLQLVSISVKTTRVQGLADLGPSYALNNPVRGLSVIGGRALVTSVVRPRGDLWLMEGLEWRSRVQRAFWRGRRRD